MFLQAGLETNCFTQDNVDASSHKGEGWKNESVMDQRFDSANHKEKIRWIILPGLAGKVLTEFLHKLQRVKLWNRQDSGSCLETKICDNQTTNLLKEQSKSVNLHTEIHLSP